MDNEKVGNNIDSSSKESENDTVPNEETGRKSESDLMGVNEHDKSSKNPSTSSSSRLFVESEQKIEDKKDALDVTTPVQRPNSAGRLRTPPTGENQDSINPENEIRNTRNLIAFDTELGNVYPDRTDSETDLIIQRLKGSLSTPPPTAEDDAQTRETGATFSTSVPEEDLAEARKRQQRRQLEQEMWGVNPYRKTMQEVIDDKVYEHYNRGVEQSSQGQFEAAITSFTKALNLQPNDVSCYVERAEAYMQLCDFRSSNLNYKKAYYLEPHNPELHEKLAFICYLEGQCLFDQCLYTEALECFTKAAEMRPNVAGYHTRAITTLAALGRNQECLALITRRLEAETTGNPELYVLRARLHLLFRNTTLCYYDVRDALSIDSEQKQAKVLMKEIKDKAASNKQQAITLTLQNKLQEALHKVTTAIETDPSVSDYHIFRGALYRRLQSFNAAIDDYLLGMDKADHNEQDPVYISAQRQLLLTYNDFAVHCYHRGFFEEAVILLTKAIKGEKQESGLYINRGDCFFKLNDLGFALADYQQALEIDPTSWEVKCRISVVHNEFGIMFYQDRQYHDAQIRFSNAIEHNPKVGQFYVHRARCMHMMQEVDCARQDILISLHLDPKNEEIIPLLSRLFPGRSVTEVMQSKAAEIARNFISTTVGPQYKLSPITTANSSRHSSTKTPATPVQPKEQGDRNTPSTPFDSEQNIATIASTPGPRKMPTDLQIIRDKKEVNEELKNIFRFPKSLKYTGPRVQSTIQPSPPKKSGKSKTQGWKKYGMGMTPA